MQCGFHPPAQEENGYLELSLWTHHTHQFSSHASCTLTQKKAAIYCETDSVSRLQPLFPAHSISCSMSKCISAKRAHIEACIAACRKKIDKKVKMFCLIPYITHILFPLQLI